MKKLIFIFVRNDGVRFQFKGDLEKQGTIVFPNSTKPVTYAGEILKIGKNKAGFLVPLVVNYPKPEGNLK